MSEKDRHFNGKMKKSKRENNNLQKAMPNMLKVIKSLIVVK
jgi:hypothetical protein